MPLFSSRTKQFCHPTQKSDHGPNLFLRQGIFLGRHRIPANGAPNDVEVPVFRHIGTTSEKVRYRTIERIAEVPPRVLRGKMEAGTIVHVEMHATDEDSVGMLVSVLG